MKYFLILAMLVLSVSVRAVSELETLVDNCSVSDQDQIKERLKAGELADTDTLIRVIGRGHKNCFWLINSGTKSFSQDDLDIMLLTASEGAMAGYLDIVKELIRKGANPIRVYYGEIIPKNSIGQALFSTHNTWSIDAKKILDYLLEVSSKENGESKEALLEKYGHKFQVTVDESY